MSAQLTFDSKQKIKRNKEKQFSLQNWDGHFENTDSHPSTWIQSKMVTKDRQVNGGGKWRAEEKKKRSPAIKILYEEHG